MAGRQYRVISKMAAFVGGALITRGTVDSFRDITLTHAQILALRATPAVLVPALGANSLTEFTGALLVVNGAAGAYTEVTANLVVRQTNTTGVIVSQSIETTGFIDQAAIKATNAVPKIDAIGQLLNRALVLHNTGAAEFGGGNAANTLRVRVFYRAQNMTGFGTLA